MQLCRVHGIVSIAWMLFRFAILLIQAYSAWAFGCVWVWINCSIELHSCDLWYGNRIHRFEESIFVTLLCYLNMTSKLSDFQDIHRFPFVFLRKSFVREKKMLIWNLHENNTKKNFETNKRMNADNGLLQNRKYESHWICVCHNNAMIKWSALEWTMASPFGSIYKNL